MKNNKIRVVTIEGPTAVGKSKLAMELAEYFSTEIISADSRQVYRYLDIGTAKPTEAEQAKVNHHLVDVVNPDEEYNAGSFRKDSLRICESLHSRDMLPLIVGGTGFYIHSLLTGLAVIPTVSADVKTMMKKRLDTMGNEQFYQELCQIDPVAAQKINYQDGHRMLRAREVYEAFGKPLSSFWMEQENEERIIPFRILVTEDREVLYRRIETRVDRMVENGLIDEIRGLLKKGYQENDPGMVTVGYREFYPYLKNELSLDKAVDLVKQHTRNYAKRQLTWYRKQDFHLTIEASNISFLEIKNKILSYKS